MIKFKHLLIALFLLWAVPSWAADAKLSALPAVGAAPAGADILYIVDGGISKKVTVTNLGAGMGAATATALGANGSNCTAGSYPLGVDASGAIESCTDATTEIDSAIATHDAIASAHHAATVDTGPSPDCAGTTTYQDGDGGCDDISSVYEPAGITESDISDLNHTTDTTLNLAGAETITGNWVNTASPWADNEVANNITVDLATTASALAANGGNCAAGSYPLGVDASGVVETCADATTEIDSAISTHTGNAAAHHTATVDTNANTVCTGTTTYLDGEGLCDDISGVYEPAGVTEADISDLSHTPATGDISDVAVTQTELAELETIGTTTVSANQWLALGGIAETLTSAELNHMDGITITSNCVIIQEVVTVDVTDKSGTTQMVLDDTIPQNTEGDEYMTVTITPTDTASKLVITYSASLSISGTVQVGVVSSIFQDSTANALYSVVSAPTTANQPAPHIGRHKMTAGTGSATTFKLRAGPTAAVTLYMNRIAAFAILGDTLESFIKVTEYSSSC